MTYPGSTGGGTDSPVRFEQMAGLPVQTITEDSIGGPPSTHEEFLAEKPYPDTHIPLSADQESRLTAWLDQWIAELDNTFLPIQQQWQREEEAYQAKSLGIQQIPFVGACGDVVPLIAMAVDPIHARLDTGIFKADPIMRITGLRTSLLDYMDSVERFVQFYLVHQINIRAVSQPRIFDFVKHGNIYFKVIYDKTTYEARGYNDRWEVEKRSITTFAGPRIEGVHIGDLRFPPHYGHIQDSPIVLQRIRTTIDALRIQEAAGKIKGVDKLTYVENKTLLEDEAEAAFDHHENQILQDRVIVWEAWCDYVLHGYDDEGNSEEVPCKLSILYEPQTKTLLSCRYNWYFHQQKPFVAAPYMVSSDSILGFGLARMLLPFQDMLTSWHRLATDNAYLANIRMFIAQKSTDIEEPPRLVSGRVFKVNDPTKDLIPFGMADIYPSTLNERQNLMGLSEKRSGVSDYLTGRESPIIGSRATATSTVALIQEGTKRVEEVLENLRNAFSEVVEMMMSIWVQYGLGKIDDIAFGGDKVAKDVNAFFSQLTRDNINGAIAVNLAATDAANNKVAQQNMQLAIIQIMMGFYEKTIQVGQLAVQAVQNIPPLKDLISSTMESAAKLFTDLLKKYDIPNPEVYIPDIDVFINELNALAAQATVAPPTNGAPGQAPSQGGVPGPNGGAPIPPDIATLMGVARGGPGPTASQPGSPGGV